MLIPTKRSAVLEQQVEDIVAQQPSTKTEGKTTQGHHERYGLSREVLALPNMLLSHSQMLL
jgi:hypothetical protein